MLDFFLMEVHSFYFLSVGVIGAVLAFWSNRKQKFELAKHILAGTVLFVIFVSATNENITGGSQFYFFPALVAAIALFGFSDIKSWLSYAVLVYVGFWVSQHTNFQLINVEGLAEEKASIFYTINYTCATFCTIIIVYFQVKLQHKSEQRIIAKDKALKESEERFRLAVEGTNAGIWDWSNINKDQQWWSPKFYELLGYKPEEIIPNKNSFKNLLVEESDYRKLILDFQNHLRKKEPFSVEYRFKCKDGSYRWFHGSGQAKWDGKDRPVRMVGSIVDITDRKKNEKEIQEKNVLLEKTNAELDRFVYSASHDLRAPLNSINGLINVAESSEDTEELKQLMGMMKNRVKKLDGFIDEIISYAKNSRTEVKQERIDLKSFGADIFENAQYRDQAAEINFKLKIKDNTILYSDAGRLSVVLNNLVDNAIKYHNHNLPKKYVTLAANVRNNQMVIEVRDNGQGIPPQAQEKIFDMFYRASDQSKGSGLGLYIVKEMVERLGGEITLESYLGEGTTFIVTLPYKVETTTEATF